MSEEETLRESRNRARQEFVERYPLREIDVDGVPWSFIAGGRGGSTILWLHGAAGEAYQMQRFIERLDGLMLFDTAAPNADVARRNRRKMALLSYLPWPLLRWAFAKSLGRLLRVPGELTEEQRLDLALAAEQFSASMGRLTKERLLALSALAQAFFASDPSASGWTGPTLVIRSKDDPSQKGLAGPESIYPRVRMIELEGVGHLGSLLRCEDYLSAFREVIEARSLRVLAESACVAHRSG